MNIDQLDQALNHLNQALAISEQDYRQAPDPSMEIDIVTLKVVISKMQKRRDQAWTQYVRGGFQS